MISRTGFTGDLGYELWVSPDKAIELWDALFEAGKHHGIRVIGTQALDLARKEAAYLAPFEDFLPAGFFEIYSQTGLLRHWNSSSLLPCGLVNRRTSSCWTLT